MVNAASELAAGQVIDRYTVEARLGEGGMATVYRVRHNTLGSHHALKVLHVLGSSVRDRLVQEGRVQAALRHPNIVAVTDVVDVNGSPGLVMEHVAGPSLDRWLTEHRPTFEEAEDLFRGILAGVARAHREGLVHRDLKPGNVLLESAEDGRLVPKVTDFGLAKILADQEPERGKTRSGVTMGTPAYMAPEQVRDAKNVDQRADVFALGCILYELCTGVSPFDRPDLLETFAALSTGSYPPPEQVVPSLPLRLRVAISGALATRPDDRVESCAVLLDVLDGTVTAPRHPSRGSSGGDTIWAPRGGSAPPRAIPRRAAPILGGLAAAGAFGVVLFLALAVYTWRAAPFAAPGLPPSPAVSVSMSPVPPGETPVPVPVPSAPAPSAPAPSAPAPAPVPASPAPAPAPVASTTGTVIVTGDASEVWLERAGVRSEVGAVPPGEYVLKAKFTGAPVSRRILVRAGRTTRVRCDAAFAMCAPATGE